MIRKVMAGAFVLALTGSAVMAAGDRWLHVRVDETGDSNQRVRVNVPLTLAEKILPLIDAKNLGEGKVSFSEGRVKLSPEAMNLETGEKVDLNLREMWQAVKETGDAQFVTVDSDHENVRVERKGAFLMIDVIDTGGNEAEGEDAAEAGAGHHAEKVTIRIPIEVVDALFSGEEDELNILAAIQALGEHKGMDLVSVDDGESKVRIWVDDVNTSE